MTSLRLTSKGRITIPAKLRRKLGLSAGDRLQLILNEDAGVFELVPVAASVTALKGILSRPRKHVSIEDMRRA
jgi:antitoxin PrlF